MKIRLWLYKAISKTGFRLLAFWLAVCFVIALLLLGVGVLLLKQDWVTVLGAFLDPGVFGGSSEGSNRIFLLITAILSIFFISSTIISVISNTLSNWAESIKAGNVRYRNLRNHILVVGSGGNIGRLLAELATYGKRIVVLSPRNPNVSGVDYIYYQGKRDNEDELASCNPALADIIYVLGENEEEGSDAKTLTCIRTIRKLVDGGNKVVKCFAMTRSHNISDIYQYGKIKESSNLLLVDFINEHDYSAEILFVHGDVLPVIHADETQSANIIILGSSDMARAAACTAAHVCHYPLMDGKIRKTSLTIIDENAFKLRDTLTSSLPGLFDLSVCSSVDSLGNRMVMNPDKDFLDIEWVFVNAAPESPLGRRHIESIMADGRFKNCILVCRNNDEDSISTALHLPASCRDSKTCVHVEKSQVIMETAAATTVFKNMKSFGPAFNSISDPLICQRSERGKRVNYIYDQKYGCPPSRDKEEAWFKIPEAHKYSSIYCALAFPLRQKCFDMNADRTEIYEAEHRRWMMSVLLMGYSSGEKTDKANFIHADIRPYDELSPEEQVKDAILIDAMDYILS